MNKKILMSIAAAATMATVFTGCGSDSSSSDKAGATATVVPADGYIYGMTGGTIGDDNLTQTVAMGTTATFTGGAHMPAPGVFIPNNSSLSVVVPSSADTNATQIMATPITTMIAAAVANGAKLEDAEKQVASVFGVNPTDAAAVAALVTVDPTNGTLTAEQRGKVAQVFVMMDQLAAAGSKNVNAALANIVAKGSTSSVSTLNASAIATAMADKATDLDANVTTAIKFVAEKVATADSEAAVNSALLSASKLTENIKKGTSISDLNTSYDANLTAANSTIQDAITSNGVPYIDGNTSIADVTLKDTNASAAAHALDKATLSIIFKNEGNANLSYAVSLKDIDLNVTGNDYAYNIANNTNVTWWATDTDGVGTAGTLSAIDADTKQTDANLTLEGAIDVHNFVNTYDTLNWLKAAANFDINESNLTGYNVNVDGNWSTTAVLSVENNDSKNVPLYISVDGNYSAAPVTTLKVGTSVKSGATVYQH